MKFYKSGNRENKLNTSEPKSEIKADQSSPSPDGAPRAGEPPAERQTPPVVGVWPGPAPKWGLIVSALLWIAWVGFLIWMLVLRLQPSAA